MRSSRLLIGALVLLPVVVRAAPRVPPTPRPATPPGPRAPRPAVAFSPDGRTLAVGGYREVSLLDPRSGARTRVLRPHAGPVTGVAFSPDGRRIAAAGGEPGRSGEIRVWDLATGRSRTLAGAHRDVVYSIAWSPDGERLVAGSYDRLLSLWDVATGRHRVLKDHTDAVYAVAFSPDGRRIASASGDRTVKIWDPASGTRLFTLGDASAELYAVAFHPGGHQVTAGGVDRSLRTWSLGPTGGSLARSAFAHDGPILRVAYSPDGGTLCTTSEDRAVKLWDAAVLTERRVLERQPEWALGLAMSADGRLVAVSRYDGSVAVYETATGRRRVPAPPPAGRTARRER